MSSNSVPDEPRAIYPVPSERPSAGTFWPSPRTSFIGREREIQVVRALLSRDDVRLVTLTGPGGVGKTRVAIRAASPSELAACFVDLADKRDPTSVLPGIAAALGIRPDGRVALDQLRSTLRQGRQLLVLDNLEHLLPAAASLACLLDACPGVQLLVTSRIVLGIPGEHVVDVRPFSLPASAASVPESQVGDIDACRLFTDRARALDPEFALTGDNAGTILAICQRLDGLPLAIELAASWVSVFSPATLLDQIDHVLTLPGHASTFTPRRHRSLRETISWSHGLLDPPAQALFRRIAVFTGGFTLDAVQGICSEAGLDVLMELRHLVANSLVRRIDDSAGGSRYVILETVREYGLDCLVASGEAETIRLQHARWYLALAERVEAKLNTVDRDSWLDVLDAEHGNLHAALSTALEQDDAELAVALCGALLPFWQFRFQSATVREWVRRALALDGPVEAAATRKAMYCAGTLAYMHGEIGEATALFTEALERYRDSDEPGRTGRVELALGRIAWDAGEQDAAQTWFEAATARFDQCGDRTGLAIGLHYLGLLAFKDHRFAEATAYLREAWAMWRDQGFTWELARCIPGHLADVARTEGHLTEAMRLYQECLSVNWAHQDLENVTWSLVGLALIANADGCLGQAAHLMTLAERCEHLTGAPLTPHIQKDYDLALLDVMRAVGTDRYAEVRAEAERSDLPGGISEALTLTLRETPTLPLVPGHALTRREQEVLRMVASGLSNREIADVLYLSVGTVKVHVTHVLAKLGVRSRAAAADYAHRHNLA